MTTDQQPGEPDQGAGFPETEGLADPAQPPSTEPRMLASTEMWDVLEAAGDKLLHFVIYRSGTGFALRHLSCSFWRGYQDRVPLARLVREATVHAAGCEK